MRVSPRRMLYLQFLGSCNICIIYLHVIEACLKVTTAMFFFPIRKIVRYHEMFLIRSILQGYLVHFSTQTRKIKKIHRQKISYISGKWNFLALILKNFSYFLKRTLFLYFRKTETPKKSLIFSQKKAVLIFPETETLKIFLMFLETELSYISGNGNPKKLLIFQEVNFQARKNKKNLPQKSFLYFRKLKPKKNFLYFLKRKLFLYFRK